LGAGTYSIIVKDANACADTSQIIFASSSALTLSNLLLGNESCTGANGSATIIISGGNAPYNYSLNGGASQNTAFFDSLPSGLYTFQVTDLSGCTLDSNFTILNVPSSVMNIPDQTLCGQEYQVTGITAGGGIWSADTAHISFSPDSSVLNPLIKSDTSGVFTIYYTNTSCSYASSFQLTFKPFPYTQILDTLICSGDEYTINALNMSQNDSYFWNTGEKGSSIKITDEGTYTVTASNDCGQYTDTAVISLQICDLEVPNVFTPNGDGSNDYFKLIYEIGVKEFSCVIVNRWGNTMRSFDKADFKWDGKDASGKLADEGTYFYIIKAKTPGGSEIKKQGFVQLVKQ
jgi:gliding motility-associated-like protein